MLIVLTSLKLKNIILIVVLAFIGYKQTKRQACKVIYKDVSAYFL